MKRALGLALKFILGWIFLTILLVFFLQARDFYGANPIVRSRLDKIEAFKNPPQDSEEVLSAGDPDLANPRQPFNLLNGWLTKLDKPVYPTAKGCRDVDFQVRLERTGNFRQLTNNYKRGDPDSCSTPLHDLTLAFYKTDPVPQYGCIQPYVE
jgi:hypothetical protein